MKVLVAITGASGVVYGKRLLEVLMEKNIETSCVLSDAAKKIIAHEIGKFDFDYHRENDITAPFASGSHKIDAMVVIPCSMKTLASIANGITSNLIARSADVTIKEGRQLILVPRETPLNAIHLENMLKLSRLGVTILPPMPAFYHKPKTLEDLVDFIVGKVLDVLRIENDLFNRWDGP
ncbi:MAG: UbiX family flavin prenyltransferase [Candidatus Hydrothermarchaeales archaeon]